MARGMGRVVVTAFAVVVGLVVAVIVTLNLHIVVGLEQGYAATPAEVFDHSVLLGVFDILLLVSGPTLGVLLVRRSRAAAPDASDTGSTG